MDTSEHLPGIPYFFEYTAAKCGVRHQEMRRSSEGEKYTYSLVCIT